MRLELIYRAKCIFMHDKPLLKIDEFIFILKQEAEFLSGLKKLFEENNLEVDISGSEDDYSTFCVETDDEEKINLLHEKGFIKEEQEAEKKQNEWLINQLESLYTRGMKKKSRSKK